MLQRKLNRLKEFDYASDNTYFITICVQNRITCLGDIVENRMILNKFGLIIQKQWLWLFDQYKYLLCSEFQIMPNHFHAILSIDKYCLLNTADGTVATVPYDPDFKIKSLSQIIGAFKTTSSKIIHNDGFLEFKWQKSYYDHIIRNQNDFERIRDYIINNPLNWSTDKFHNPNHP